MSTFCHNSGKIKTLSLFIMGSQDVSQENILSPDVLTSNPETMFTVNTALS